MIGFLFYFSKIMVFSCRSLQAALKRLEKNKVPNMAVLLKSLVHTHADARAVFKDPTGNGPRGGRKKPGCTPAAPLRSPVLRRDGSSGADYPVEKFPLSELAAERKESGVVNQSVVENAALEILHLSNWQTDA